MEIGNTFFRRIAANACGSNRYWYGDLANTHFQNQHDLTPLRDAISSQTKIQQGFRDPKRGLGSNGEISNDLPESPDLP